MKFLHTMLRVGNLQRSIDFYTQVLGMQLLRQSENPEYKYSLAFLGFEGGNPGQAEIELTYNWGVESYDMGTAYGHIALGVPDAYAACEKIKAAGGNVTREPGPVKGGSTVIAFVTDPDGYKIELIQRAEGAGGIGIGHADGDVAIGRAHVVLLGAPVVGQLDLGLAGVAAVEAQKGQRILVFGVLGRAQQLHAQHLGVEVDGALEVAHAQHGVQDSHAPIVTCLRDSVARPGPH